MKLQYSTELCILIICTLSSEQCPWNDMLWAPTVYLALLEEIIFLFPFPRYIEAMYWERGSCNSVQEEDAYKWVCLLQSYFSQTSIGVSCHPERTGAGTEPIKLC
jgi:hypothetical protein